MDENAPVVIAEHEDLPVPVTREQVLAAEQAMMQRPEAYVRGGERDVDELCPVKHYFSQGVYAREMFIPKGTVVIGMIHKYQQLNIMSQGELSVLTEDGVKRVKAPFTIVSPPGTKRIAYAHEDTVWTTIHGTDETDLDKIEAKFIARTEQDYLAFCKALEHKEQQ